jgi:hypothetical protein
MQCVWCVGVLSCSEKTFIDLPTQAAIEVGGDAFWSLPFPSDLRLREDGSYGLQDWPEANSFLSAWLEAADHFLDDGWGLSSGVFIPLSGDIDTSTLPKSAQESLGAESSVFLLDTDPRSPERGKRIPVDVSIVPSDLLSPQHLLAIIPAPGFVRKAQTTYAAVVTNRVWDPSGEVLGRSPSFHAAFENQKSPDAVATQNYQLLRATLADLAYSTSDVVGAAVFTTFNQDKMLHTLRDWTENLAAPSLVGDWVVADEYDDYVVLTNAYPSPVIQADNRPYDQAGEGKIVWDASGLPVIQQWQDIRLALSLPKQSQPAAGFPLTIYLHGSGGDWREAIDRGPIEESADTLQAQPALGTGPAQWLARRGVATLSFDFPLHGDRHSPPDTSGLVFYNLLTNPMVTIYNFHVAAMELLRLSRLSLDFAIDASLSASLDPGVAADSRIRIDPERLSGFGHSMGSTLGVPWASVDPRIKGMLLSGAGGMLVEIATSATEPSDVNGALSFLSGMGEQRFHRAHPMLHALQNMWDLVDPVAKAHHLIVDPVEGLQPKDIMMTAGHLDGYFHPRAQASLAIPLGVSPVSNDLNDTLQSALDLAERTTQSYPLQDNINGKCGGLVAYTAEYDLGHYVVFNQDKAHHQYTCFIASIGSDSGAMISAPAAFDSGCSSP